MFDVGFWELVLIGVVALVVLGPERLPTAARTAGLLIGKLRRTVYDVKSEIERELQVDEIRRVARQESDKLRGSLHDLETRLVTDERPVDQQTTSQAPSQDGPGNTTNT